MSFDSIDKFQKKIYKIVSAVPLVQKHIKRIYVSTRQDGRMPFILINIVKVVDVSLPLQEIYELDFEISLYSNSVSTINSLQIVSKMKQVLGDANANFDDYEIAAMRNRDLQTEQGKDLSTQKVTLKYSALIKQRMPA